MTSSKIFKRRDFLWDKNTLEWKIRSLGSELERKHNVAKRKDLNQKLKLLEICVKLWRFGEETYVTKRITD